MTALLPELPKAGFCFENFQRNEMLKSKGMCVPKMTKTGTTIVGICLKDTIILGADTRATAGDIIATKKCEKIHYLNPNMRACGAGTAADNDYVTRMLSSQLELHRLNTGKPVPVVAAVRMVRQYLFRYQGYVGAAMIIGGVDNSGPHLYAISPHGCSSKAPYVAYGSGSLAAYACLEANWKDNMTVEEGTKLVRDAIAAGIFNDLGSGNNIDICIITKAGVDMKRAYEEACVKGKRIGNYLFKPGTTAILSRQEIPLEVEEVIVRHFEEKMDTSA
ncbi:proteasome beta2 subunit-like protein [Leptotrombidium deliense]|uniref:proteasome endopeptidase complex n=1 Tax=Leptotrombidium deliense TaxID=299467 RepID=A0A443SG76_9ACAR|nr:proteasome beta2 subunit-like protein [Leptotrombidium deliense]